MPPRSPSSLLSQRGASRDEAWKHEVDQRLARLEEMLRPWKRLKKFAMDKGDSESTVRRDAKAGLVELRNVAGRTYARDAADPPSSTEFQRRLPRRNAADPVPSRRPPKAADAIVIDDPSAPQFPFRSAAEPRSQ